MHSFLANTCIHCMHIVYYTQERDKNFEDEFLRNRFWFILPTKSLRTSFSPTVELFLIKGSRLFIIFDFQQLLLLTNFDQTHSYRDRIEAMFLEFFFSLSHLHCADGNFEDEFLPNRWTFFIGSPRLFIIFDFQQLLLMTNFDQTHGYGDCIIFGDIFDRVKLLVTLFHRSIDRAILLVTLFDPSQFGDTFGDTLSKRLEKLFQI